MPNIHNDDERGAALGGRVKSTSVAFSLAARPAHGRVPLARGPDTMSCAAWAGWFWSVFGLGQGSLLGFEDKAAPPVEVYAPQAGCPVAILEHHPTLEDIGVCDGIVDGRIRPGNVEDVAQFCKEQLGVRPFRSLGSFPPSYEFIKLFGHHEPI